MRIRSFTYHTVKSIDEALHKLDQYSPEIKVLAGGTDLVPAMKQKDISPRHLLNLLDISELCHVTEDKSVLRIGALVRHSELASHPLITNNCSILSEAVGLIGSWQIRNIATIGGNLCNASPAADSAPPLLALDASVTITESGEEKEIPVLSFFTGPGSTVVRPNQLLKEIVIPIRKCKSFGTYLKLTRKQGVDLSVVGVAFYAELDENNERLERVSSALGGVAPTPIRASEAEAELTGLSYKKALEKIPTAARAAVAATHPITDVRASAEYRRAIVDVYVQRAATKVLGTLFDKDRGK